MGLGIRGLEDFSLTVSKLRQLGKLQIDVRVALAPKMYDPRLVKLPRPIRLTLYRTLKKRSVAHVLRIWPEPVILEGEKDCPIFFRSKVAAKLISVLAKDREIDSIELVRIPGHRRRRIKEPSALTWYAVRAFVAIEVEGQKSGMQTTEDRIVLVRAHSESDARLRLKKEWKQYETPSLNEDGYLVRWKMQKVVHTYELIDGEINPNGTEVYSHLGIRRMKLKYQWNPFKESTQTREGSRDKRRK